MVCKRPWERKDLGVRGREIGLGIQMAEGAWLAWMQSEAKVPSCFMQIWQTTAAYMYINVLPHKVHGNFPSCIDFNQLWVLLVANHRTWILCPRFFFLHIETLQGAGGGGGGGGWITVRRKVLAPAPPPFPSLFCESNLVPSGSAHTREVFGQPVFALAGKWLFEVGRTTVIIGGPAIRFAGLQLQARRKWPTCRGSQQTNRSYMYQDQMSYFGLTFQCRPWE